MSDEHTEEVVHGERVARSPISGCFYVVTKWIDHGDGKTTALQKRELSDAEVVERVDGQIPEEWRKSIDETVWNEVEPL